MTMLWPFAVSLLQVAFGLPFSVTEPGDLEWAEPPETLLQIIGNKSNYDRQKTPQLLFGKTTNVHAAVYLESMSSFKSVSMDFEVDMYLMLAWVDERLKHNYQHPILITDQGIANKIWTPDCYFVNSKAATLQTVTYPNLMVLVHHDGFVMKSQRISVTLSCPMDFSLYPMDEQSCPILIQSYAYVKNMVNLSWYEDAVKGYPINYNTNIRLNDMLLIGRTHKVCTGNYPLLRQDKGVWSCLEGRIRMKRYILFHMIHMYIPTALLVIVSWLSFWLDNRSAPARVGLTITTLLTLTTMANGARQGLPQVNYIKAIDIWLFVSMGMIFAVLLEYTLIWFYIGRSHKSCRKHAKDNVLLNNNHDKGDFKEKKNCPGCKTMDESRALRVDSLSRFLFPLAFLIFCIAYWGYYLSHYFDNYQSPLNQS